MRPSNYGFIFLLLSLAKSLGERLLYAPSHLTSFYQLYKTTSQLHKVSLCQSHQYFDSKSTRHVSYLIILPDLLVSTTEKNVGYSLLH